jgi:hypothetical protein
VDLAYMEPEEMERVLADTVLEVDGGRLTVGGWRGLTNIDPDLRRGLVVRSGDGGRCT